MAATAAIVFTSGGTVAWSAPGNNLTPGQRAKIVKALTGRGADAATAQEVASSDQAASVAVGRHTESGTVVNRHPATGGRGGVVPYALGSCSGYSGYDWVRSYVDNAVGVAMASIYLQTNWCFNYSRVTYAASYRTYTVYAAGSLNMVWEGWAENPVEQYFYTSGGHVNGGVFTYSEGEFGNCILHYGCLNYIQPWTETRNYWNGTSLESGGR
ncbi:hypothetical protein [Nostocoides sp. HKS02]|uniref:hypothetical protein n=1 Tax=Nostocoides sp. HKS02 TaxID=1813880 RepID=UPI0012B49AC2|nr:hypothetical protein [Tetrasphaera sp. HKS02]QGN57220.1 hypothetical protein GKE56_04280 [Tetrasphaera sp. HKS02]